ncbi:hypothetical protein SKAU_G00140440 [Synaphobranchus kaupii]|uniref:Uncharacterized protein n=1 Tax=Synaphobranchus kaupii TaxID=118154 RepID=A0A9Q1FT64_SYNKA|nr:hypothetical protein SKAU_G00140440 [Synaphobranchus kaupii]
MAAGDVHSVLSNPPRRPRLSSVLLRAIKTPQVPTTPPPEPRKCGRNFDQPFPAVRSLGVTVSFRPLVANARFRLSSRHARTATLVPGSGRIIQNRVLIFVLGAIILLTIILAVYFNLRGR